MAEEVNLTSTPVGAQETREVLSGVNTTTAPVLVGDSEYSELTSEGSHEVMIGVYLDGTWNNRSNTLARLEYEKRENGLVYNEELANKHSESIASANVYLTNVARMEDYHHTQQTENLIIDKVYVEGAGTEDNQEDSKVGGAMGTGTTGIEEKVKKALEKTVEKVATAGVEKITKLTIDVFGFSRGAASARYLTNEVLKRSGDFKSRHPRNNKITYYEVDYGFLGEQLEAQGIEINQLEVRFIGLYDTVSAHGMGAITGYDNDTETLGLDAVSRGRFTLHLTANDEHRRNFSLTNINSALNVNRGKEFGLPGVHGDLGGSYNNGEKEERTFAIGEKEYLISEGWYREDQIKMVRNGRNSWLKAKRENISNEYGRIPLTVMTEYALQNRVPLDGEGLKVAHPISNPLLLPIKERIFEQVFNNGPSLDFSNPSDQLLLRPLRNQFLHFSAINGNIVSFPRRRVLSGDRYRKVIDG